MFKYKKTIFLKLLMTYLLLIIAVMALIAFLLSWGYSNYVFKGKQEELRLAAKNTDLLVERYRDNQISYLEMNRSLDILSNMTNSRIYAVSYSSHSLDKRNVRLDQEFVDSYLLEDLKTILKGEEVTRQKQYSDNLDTHVIFVGVPLKNSGNIEGAILLFAPIDEINANIARINMIIWLSALAAVMLSGIVIYFISLRISSPLKRMEEKARRIAEGEQVTNLAIDSGDELEKMAQAFNYMKNKISAAESMRREFIASVSHDLKTPLTTINGFVQGMLDGLVKAEDTPKYLKIIQEETQRLLRLTGDILELAKLQSGGSSLSRKYIQVKELIERVMDSTGAKSNDKDIQIQVVCPAEIEVYADEDRFKQILVNLLDNAIKFTPRQGEIHITVEEDQKIVTLRIQDNGQGIAPEDLPYVLEKFYRGDKSRQESTGGTGLGLNIVKTLVESHGGKVEVKSQWGQGTEINLYFPQ